MSQDVIDKVNQMGKEEGEKEGIIYTGLYGSVTMDNFDIGPCGDNDDNSNESDKSFEFNDEQFEVELENENIMDNEL